MKPKPKPRTCLIPDCTRKVDSRGVCKVHYNAWRLGYLKHPEVGVFKPWKKERALGPKEIDRDGRWPGICDYCGKPGRINGIRQCKECRRKLLLQAGRTDDNYNYLVVE